MKKQIRSILSSSAILVVGSGALLGLQACAANAVADEVAADLSSSADAPTQTTADENLGASVNSDNPYTHQEEIATPPTVESGTITPATADVVSTDAMPQIMQVSSNVSIGQTVGESAHTSAPAEAAHETDESSSVANLEVSNDNTSKGDLAVNYFAVFYGPSVKKPTAYQPLPNGDRDLTKPVMLKNFLSVGYSLTDTIALTPTAYWQYMPIGKQQASIQDPFLKLSDSSIVSGGGFNLYGDVRFHFPLSQLSRQSDTSGSAQSVQIVTYQPEGTRWTFAVWGSERAYFYGPTGAGNDLELYLGPNANYQLTPTVALTMLYEVNGAHVYGEAPGLIRANGSDLQPGLDWDITPTVSVNPYVSLNTSAPVTLCSTSMGFFFNWKMI